MARFSDLHDFVLTDLRQIETPLVDFYIRQVGRDWFKATTQWREVIPLTLSVGLTDYRLVPAAGGQVAGVINMPNADSNGAMRNMAEGAQFPGTLEPGAPDGWWQTYPGVVRFRRPPDKAYALQVTVFKTLTLDVQDDMLPDDAFDNYAEALAYGVKARLQAMPTKPWTDNTMAAVNNTFYTKAKFAARALLRDGGQTAHQRVVAPLFAGR
jgi:hypothetical protein